MDEHLHVKRDSQLLNMEFALYCNILLNVIDPETFYGNRYKQIKLTHPRFIVFWCKVITCTTKF